MEATRNCTIAIGATQKAGQQANSLIDPMYEGYISRLIVVQPLVMPDIRHACVLLSLVMPHVRHVHLGRKGKVIQSPLRMYWFSPFFIPINTYL